MPILPPAGPHALFSRISVSNFNLNSFSASLRDRNLVQPPLRYRTFDAIYEARRTRFVSAFGIRLYLAMRVPLYVAIQNPLFPLYAHIPHLKVGHWHNIPPCLTPSPSVQNCESVWLVGRGMVFACGKIKGASWGAQEDYGAALGGTARRRRRRSASIRSWLAMVRKG